MSKDGVYDERGEYKPKQYNVPSIYSVEHQEAWKKLIESIPEQPINATEKYLELLYAVSRKFPNETRHETALRYIREAEQRATDGVAKESTNG